MRTQLTSSHWGTYWVDTSADGQRITAARPRDDDPAAPAIGNVATSQHHRSRITAPAVRRSWLDNGPGPSDRRGRHGEEFLQVGWDATLDLLAAELDRVRKEYGNQAIYGGSYGWGSAGRFHHPQSQVHRFLNSIGGYTRSVNSYSRGTSLVSIPYLLGSAGDIELRNRPASWDSVRRNTDILLTFGGLRPSNAWVTGGGRDRHTYAGEMAHAARTTRIISVSPLRDDTQEDLGIAWQPIRPSTDVALILSLLHVLVSEDLADWDFLATYTLGHREVVSYVLGEDDGVPKDPRWGATITGIKAEDIVELARTLAGGRTLVNVGWSLQRSRFGEQPVAAGITLAAFLGQIGLPGGGFGHGYGSMGDYAGGTAPDKLPTLPQGINPVSDFIPCARISDLLLSPGKTFPYNGQFLQYPDIRLAYWAGGNPFHHHQDLLKLQRAFGNLDTLVVHETHWTPTAKHADIVIPASTTLEREDIAAGPGDTSLRPMHRIVPPPPGVRDEYDTFAALSTRLGTADSFTEGRSSGGWIEHLYSRWKSASDPAFEDFWQGDGLPLPAPVFAEAAFQAFRNDPIANPLDTPSGKIELFSQQLAGYGLADCPPRVTWLDSNTEPGAKPGVSELHLMCNQPATRLHSQHDMGDASQATKIRDREPILIHPDDASERGISDGDIVRVSSARGSILAGARLSTDPVPGVVQMHTGAWFDNSAPDVADCIAGNVNVLTGDWASSSLSQGSVGANCRVIIERYDGPVPAVHAYEQPHLTQPAH
ncbi:MULTISPECIES: molybdopterin-dependent oxidoreductase [unclassified Pseudarthrobacter]|uniref:molybdopterin-dependent oxidoreductase n=1 Tax=unclassified Pseudarthrobacter TaxID=2647000 RepID=UPI00362526F4